MKLERFKAITENELLFVEGGELYRNIPLGECTGATVARNNFHYTSSGGRICRGSRLTIRSWKNNEIVGMCKLGEFKLLKVRESISEAPPDSN
jgi:hypothetical protein